MPKVPPVLAGRRVTTCFVEASTRTKLSFTTAARRLGAEVMDFGASTSSLTKGESLQDTVRTLMAIGSDFIVVRHPAAGAAHVVERVYGPGVLNAGDGAHAHPTQALLDLVTIREKVGWLDGLTIAIVGDSRHARVAHSHLEAHKLLGNRVVLVGPKTLAPDGLGETETDFDKILPQADVVMMLRLQTERMDGGFIPSTREFNARWGLTPGRLERLRGWIMAPGPVNPGVEIGEDGVTHPRSLIRDQVENGVWTRMAVLTLIARSRWPS